MYVQEMDSKYNSACDKMQVLTSSGSKPTTFRNTSHTVRLVEELQSLRKDAFLCDIKLVTDDGSIVNGHKNVLVAASPYFRVMFGSFNEMNKNEVNLKELDSTVLELLVDYMYTGEISVTIENVQVLLPAANILQLDYVSTICEDFMKLQLDPSNCLGVKAFADFHNCTELFSSSEAFIKKYFIEVTECDEFLSLSFEEVIKLICYEDINIPSEEKVFECVIKWVKHELNCRKELLPKLMEHVRLPLVSFNYLLNKVGEEPLVKNSLQCESYIIEALRYLHNKEHNLNIPETIWAKPRQSSGLHKVILMIGWCAEMKVSHIKYYDPKTKLSRIGPETKKSRQSAGLALLRDRYLFALGGVFNSSSSRPVEMLDVASQSSNWKRTMNMTVSRKYLGVGVLNNCIYAIGGSDGNTTFNSAEVFNRSKWSMVSSMSTKRDRFGVGVLNNLLYAVGGHDGLNSLKSVECYDYTLNSWTPVVEMSVPRQGLGVAVLDGVLYAIGGYGNGSYLKSAEAFRPSDGVWSSIADMHMCRLLPGVVALNGLLYVMGGRNNNTLFDSIEVYNPNTNTWTVECSTDGNAIHYYGGIVVSDNHI